MSINEVVALRGIKSVLHFTTNRGVLGILASQSLKARARLNEDEKLKHIFQPNAANRERDAKWLDYVNLSISRINKAFFDSSGACHRDKGFWWCILSFSPEILEHEGVWFTTTNNIYSGVRRNVGEAGLEATFADRIVRWESSRSSSIISRAPELGAEFTTCLYAEVLYPGELSTEFLQCIYVSSDNDADELMAQIAVVAHPSIPVNVNSAMFAEML